MADFYRELISYCGLLERKIRVAEDFLRSAPEGYLSCNCKNGKVRYSWKEGGVGAAQKKHASKTEHTSEAEHAPVRKKQEVKYLSASDSATVHSLAQKRYYQQLLPVMFDEKKLLDNLIRELDKNKKERCYSDANEYRKALVKPEFCMPEDNERAWINVECEDKEMKPEVKTVRTRNGESVRSKSEKIIADELLYRGIPYRYEAELKLGGVSIFPDFTVLNSRSGKEYYLEHLGMMDNADYYGGVIRRLDLYAQNGIFVGDRLLLTYETSHYAINTAQLNHIIEKYLM